MRLLDLFRRPAAPVRARSYDAARPATRRGLGTFGAINGEIGAAGGTIRSRARHGAANNGLLSNAVGNWTTALVGPGIEPTSPDAEALARWKAWRRTTNFDGTLAAMVRAMVVDGEALAVWRGDRLAHLPIEQLSDETRGLGDGAEIVNGVELDAMGDPVAYWVYPGRHESGDWRAPVRVEAADVLHLFAPVAAGQIRGVSWLAPAILPAHELDQLQDALVTRAKVAAMLTGFIESVDGPALDLESEIPSLEPGSMWRLGGGERVNLTNPTPSVENGALVSVLVRQIAAGLGLPAHLVDGDLSGANYSSLRAGLLPFRARLEQIQYTVIVPTLLDPAWSRVTLATAPEWLMPKPAQVDPMKAVAADVAELKAGLTSRRKLVAERGWNLDDLDAELASEGWKPE